MIVERGRQQLGREECLALLSRATLGRIGVSAGALPHVEPVHFRLVGEEILMRVGRRTRLDIAATDNVVAFEVDSFDTAGRTGWSIVVTDVARRVDEAELIERLESLDVPSWSIDTGDCVLAISTDVIAGERILSPVYEHAGPATDRRGTAEVLGLDECWALLAAEEVGRLAVIRGDAPLVVPINYAVDGRAILFRTDPGTKFHQGPRSKVSFEIDGLDHASRFGWSVVATGHLTEITPHDGDAYARAAQLVVQPWAGGGKRHMMRLVPTSVTGRRVGRLGPVRSPRRPPETPDAR